MHISTDRASSERRTSSARWRGAVEAVRWTLRDGQLPKRSWILFFDADLCGESVAVSPDTPAPPAADDE